VEAAKTTTINAVQVSAMTNQIPVSLVRLTTTARVTTCTVSITHASLVSIKMVTHVPQALNASPPTAPMASAKEMLLTAQSVPSNTTARVSSVNISFVEDLLIIRRLTITQTELHLQSSNLSTYQKEHLLLQSQKLAL